MLAHLINRFKQPPETVLTSALVHVLNESDAVWDSLLALLHEAGVSLPRALTLQEQAGGPDGLRPDIAGLTWGGAQVLLIELKLGAPFTEGQPASYLGRFHPGQPGVLLIVGPRHRMATLWEDITARCSAAGKILHEIKALPSGAQSGTASGGHRVVLVSWQDLIGRFEDAVSTAATGEYQRTTSADLVQIQGMFSVVSKEAFTPFTEQELSTRTPQVVLQLWELLEELKDRAVNSPDAPLHGRFALSGYRTPRHSWRWGYELTLDQLHVYLHLDLDKWLDQRDSPLWLTIRCRDEAEADAVWNTLCAGSHTATEDPHEWHAVSVPLKVLAGSNMPEALESLEQQLADLSLVLAPLARTGAQKERTGTPRELHNAHHC